MLVLLPLLLSNVVSLGTKGGKQQVLFQISFFRVCFSGFQGAVVRMGEAPLAGL